MHYTKKCEHCGHVLSAYTHNLNKGQVTAFNKFMERYFEMNRPINVNTEIKLTHNQLAGFRQLKFFGLVGKAEIGGHWYPTPLGVGFYYGEKRVQSPVATFNDEVLPLGHKAWETHDKAIGWVYITDLLPEHYKRRPEYMAEKSPQKRLF